MQNNIDENKIKLSPYYIVYMDILGAKKYIESEESEKYLNKIQKVFSETIGMIKLNYSSFLRAKPKLKIFSDNIVLAIPKIEYFGDAYNDINSCSIIISAALIQIIALKNSLLVRGGISVDDLYIDDNFVYGKALIQAYKLESEIAIYPRIIINPKDIHLFINSDFQQRIIQTGSDNIYYIDPFETYFGFINENVKFEELKTIQNKLQEKIQKEKNDKINQKICWFINMFNDFCKRNNYYDYLINLDNYPYPEEKKEVETAGDWLAVYDI